MGTENELRSELQSLNRVIKRMNFRPRTTTNASFPVRLTHPIDNEGSIDRDYLVIRTAKNQMEIWCHYSGINVDHYHSKLTEDDLSAVQIRKLISILA